MRHLLLRNLLLSLAVVAGLAGATQASAAELYGRWKNPKNSVHVDIRPCGESACGYVVWASEKAKEDARRGSGKELVGMQLLRDFKPTADGWRGKVFVPDLNRTFSGAAKVRPRWMHSSTSYFGSSSSYCTNSRRPRPAKSSIGKTDLKTS